MSSERSIVSKLRENYNQHEDQNKYVVAACAATMFSNDMRHIHLHSSGEDFEAIHCLSDSYRSTSSYDVDTLLELALEYNECVPNMSFASEYVEWDPITGCKYESDQVYTIIFNRIETYIKYLVSILDDQVEPVRDDIKDVINNMIRYWSKEANYKSKRKMKPLETTSAVIATSIGGI